MHKKNLIKLLPAVAVIIAVAAAGFQQDSEVKSAKTVQASESKLVKSSELESLLTAAYFNNGEIDNADSSSLKTKKSKSKIKKTGITTGKTKALPEKSAAASGQGQGTTTTPTTSVPEGGYKDGTYQGSGTGFGGTITVEVTISGGKIASITILSAAGETASYFASAQGVISRILSGQTPNVDAVSGATYSSNGIIQAVQNALAKAGNNTATKPVKTNKKNDKKTNTTTKPVEIPKPSGNIAYKDGTYTAEADGFNGSVKVTVTIKNGKITNISNSNTDTKEYFNKAWSRIQPAILKKQAVYGVDTVSGATFSSNGILEAVQKALAKAAVNITPTAEPTATPTPTEASKPGAPASLYKDGTYTGRARGYSGFVTITITIKDGKITDISNTNTDTASFFNRAWKKIQPSILQNQSADGIDTVSGATYSSEGILGGAKKALTEALAIVTPEPTTTPKPTAAPESTVTPTPTKTPDPTVTPEATVTPEPTAAPEPTEIPGAGYKDGTYTGTGEGFNGPITVTITVSQGNIVSASYDGEDDEPEFSDAWNGIYEQVLGRQSADGIDTVSGATYSSNGLIQAFQSAISQAK
nr:FMN-binding protein [uncultured Blautia sp.]